MTHQSIIFHLDLDLKLAQVSFVNSGSEPGRLEILEEIWRDDKSLNLSEVFEPLWAKYYEEYFSKADEFYLLIGPKAGFTDSRVIFIWLKTQLLFESKTFFVHKLNSEIELENLDQVMLTDLLNGVRSENNQNLTYSAKPRIGKR